MGRAPKGWPFIKESPAQGGGSAWYLSGWAPRGLGLTRHLPPTGRTQVEAAESCSHPGAHSSRAPAPETGIPSGSVKLERNPGLPEPSVTETGLGSTSHCSPTPPACPLPPFRKINARIRKLSRKGIPQQLTPQTPPRVLLCTLSDYETLPRLEGI